MFGRRIMDERKKVKEIVDLAVKKARRPGDADFGTPTSSTGGSTNISPSVTGTSTMTDENGDTLHPFTLDVDKLDDPKARLL